MDKKSWDITFGHGLPFVWVKCNGIQPSLRGGTNIGADKGTIEVQSLTGGVQSAGMVDAFIVKVDGNAYGVYGPLGMSVSMGTNSVDIKFADPDNGWLAVGV